MASWFFFVLFLLCVVFPQRHYSPDLFLHLYVGEKIKRCRCIPKVDEASFTHRGKPWHLNAYLGSLLLQTLYQWGDWGALLFKALLLFGFASLFFLFVKKRKGSDFWSVLSALPFFYVLSLSLDFNPYLFSFLLAEVSYLLLFFNAPLVLFPILFLLWVQLHPGFWVGFGQLLIALMTRPVYRKKKSLALALASLAMFFVHPSGVRAAFYPFYLQMGGTFYKENLLMWRPLAAGKGWDLAVVVYFVLFLFVFIFRKKLSLFSLGNYLLFAVLPLTAIRHLPFLMLLGPMLVVEAMSSDHRPSPQLDSGLISTIPHMWRYGDRQAARLASGLSCLALCYFGLFGLLVHLDSDFRLKKMIRFHEFPVGAVEFLRVNHLKPRLFHPYDWGNFLYYHGFPVFIDGRGDTLYPDAFFSQYLKIRAGERDFRQAFERYEVEGALLRKGTPLVFKLKHDSDYVQVYEDELSLLFLRKELARKQFTYPKNFFYYFQKGSQAFQEGRVGEARKLWQKALQLRQDTPEVLSNLGYLALRRGDKREAKRYFHECLKLRPEHAPCRNGLRMLKAR